MKRAVSISIGSSERDHKVEVELLGQRISIERIGTDGDIDKATRLYNELDGQVDALGVGGTDLYLRVGDRWYPFRRMHRMVSGVKKTPVVDGAGVRRAVERQIMQFVEKELGTAISPKTCLITVAADRYDMAQSAVAAGYETVFGDLMFGLGIDIPLHTLPAVHRVARVLCPIVTRLPFEWFYPTGAKQSEHVPKWSKYYHWASVIAGDFHYVKRYILPDMTGKVIVTNTTTSADLELLRECSVAYLVTTTPRLEGRTFGTNAMEAALIALAGVHRPLTDAEIQDMLTQLHYTPTIIKL